MSNKAEEAADRVLAHMDGGGTYTVRFSVDADGGWTLAAVRSDGAAVDEFEVFALIAGASVHVEDAMNAMEKGK